jgi:hypothetical protein
MTENLILSDYANDEIPPGSEVSTHHDLLNELSEMVLESSQTKIAAQLGITVQYLNDILHGKRIVSSNVAKSIGWKRLTVFVKE